MEKLKLEVRRFRDRGSEGFFRSGDDGGGGSSRYSTVDVGRKLGSGGNSVDGRAAMGPGGEMWFCGVR